MGGVEPANATRSTSALRNEWTTAIREALAGDNPVPAPPTYVPHAFSLADPAIAEGILTAAGFAEISFTDVREPVYYGPDPAVAFDVVRGLRSTRDLLAGLDQERPTGPWTGCAPPWRRTRTPTACSSTRAPGSSTPGAAENSARLPRSVRLLFDSGRRKPAPSRQQMYVPVRAVIAEGKMP